MHLRRIKLACERGFTTVTLMGVLAVGGLLVAAGFATVDPDISLSREDQDYKQAYAAAESGLQWYLNSLGRDNNYYLRCSTGLPDPSPGQRAPVNQKWNGSGADPRIWRALPEEQAQYTIELLPAPGFSACVPSNQYSMIDAEGNMRLRVTGRSRGEYRTVLATLRRRNFIDFVYFTDFETISPAAYSDQAAARAACGVPRASRRGRGCTEIRFADTDDQLGPVHTNDNFLVCGRPQFGRTIRDRVEASTGAVPFEDSGCGSVPDVRGRLDHPAQVLGMPPSNAAIRDVALPEYRFVGKTKIKLEGDTMLVWNPNRFGLTETRMNLPSNGVIWVGALGSPCTNVYDRNQGYENMNQPESCGDVWVKGDYGRDLTIAADHDLIINGHLRGQNDELLLGLIANNFVRVYHPVDEDCDENITGANGYIHNLEIEAAILALRDSFIVDNWGCGDPTGTLKVTGAIAQSFRGPVGTGSGTTIVTGYRKHYEYNDRLRYREPPYFLDPVQAAWRIARQNEQVPASAPGL